MTNEQIALEYALINKDIADKKRAAGGQVYDDDEYEDYDNETDEKDKILSDSEYQDKDNSVVLPVEKTSEDDEWEEVDDF